MPIDSISGQPQKPLKSYDWYSSLVPDDYPIRKSLSMLHDQGMDTPSVRFGTPKLPRKYFPETQGYTNAAAGDPNVHVNNWTDNYRKAAKNDPQALKNLGAIIAHEGKHLSGGPEEGQAYDEQIRALTAFGSDPKELLNMQKNKAWALRQAELSR